MRPKLIHSVEDDGGDGRRQGDTAGRDKADEQALSMMPRPP